MGMSACLTCHDGAGSEPGVERALALCTEALEICDALQLSGVIGARLQHVISSLEEVPRL
jgi:hypothetical protein